MKNISVIVPVYFEEECIEQFIQETLQVLNSLQMKWEIIFIDDGSTDKTVQIIKKHAHQNTNIKLIEFSYNHGKQSAVTAGIHYASGDILLYMDPDLQDPPLEISRFIKKIDEGYDLVFGVREQKCDTLLNKIFSKIFWKSLNTMTNLNLPENLAVMRSFNKKFAEQFLKYNEQNRFIEGIFAHISLNKSCITIQQKKRYAGHSKFNFTKKIQLAFDAIFDFSEIPLKLAIKFGFFCSIFGLLFLLIIVILKLFLLNFAAGWPSLFGIVILSMGINLFFLGICAIYIGKIYQETKHRPLFSIKNFVNFVERK